MHCFATIIGLKRTKTLPLTKLNDAARAFHLHRQSLATSPHLSACWAAKNFRLQPRPQLCRLPRFPQHPFRHHCPTSHGRSLVPPGTFLYTMTSRYLGKHWTSWRQHAVTRCPPWARASSSKFVARTRKGRRLRARSRTSRTSSARLFPLTIGCLLRPLLQVLAVCLTKYRCQLRCTHLRTITFGERCELFWPQMTDP